MMRTATLLFLCVLVTRVFGQVSSFEEAIRAGDAAFFNRGDFKAALDMYLLAPEFDDSESNREIVKTKVSDVLTRINELKEAEEQQKLKAKAERDTAKAERGRADRATLQAIEQGIMADSLRAVAEAAKAEAEAMLENERRFNALVKAETILQKSNEQRSRPQLQGLMALYALQRFREGQADTLRPDLVSALRNALDALELDHPARIGLTSPPAGLSDPDTTGRIIQLGDDGHLYTLDPRTGQNTMLLPPPVSVMGMDEVRLIDELNIVMLGRAGGGVVIWSSSTGEVIARAGGNHHRGGISAMTAFDTLGPYLTGDRAGQLVLWQRVGSWLDPVRTWSIGGVIKDMVRVPGSNEIAVINKTDTVRFLNITGGVREVPILPYPTDERAQAIAVDPGSSEVFIGSTSGSVFRVPIGEHGEGEELKLPDLPAIETIRVDPDGTRLAFITAGQELVVIDPDQNAGIDRNDETRSHEYKGIRIPLGGSPSRFVFGPDQSIFLGYGLRVERAFFSISAMERRICALLHGVTWYEADGMDATMDNSFLVLGIDTETPSPCAPSE